MTSNTEVPLEAFESIKQLHEAPNTNNLLAQREERHLNQHYKGVLGGSDDFRFESLFEGIHFNQRESH